MRIFKYFAISLTTLAVFLGGGLWYAHSHASEWVKNYVNELGQSIGYVIDFNELNINLKSPRVAISELKILEVANGRQLLHVKNIEASASWNALLLRKIELNQVQIDQASILAEKYPDQWNWLKFISAIQKKFPSKADSQPAPPKQFLIKELLFRDGNLKIEEPSRQFLTEFKPLNFELKQVTNLNSKGSVGGLETKYGIDLGQVTLPIPKSSQKLILGNVLLGGDFDLDANKNLVLSTKAKIDEGTLNLTTRLDQANNQLESDITIESLSLIPFIDFATPKVVRTEKSGLLFGQLKVVLRDKNLTLDGDIQVEQLSLAPFISLAPTINTIYAKSGGAGGHFKIHYDPENTKVQGDIQLSQLALYEPDKTSELLGWKSANVNQFYFEENPRSRKLRVDDVKIDGLKGRFVIYGDKSSNFRRMFKPSSEEIKRIDEERKKAPLNPPISLNTLDLIPTDTVAKKAVTDYLRVVSNTNQKVTKPVHSLVKEDEDKPSSVKGANSKKPMNFNMKSIQITRGNIEFSDFSIKPNFKTNIENFHGTLIGISTYPKRYATGAFEGLIAPNGDMQLKAKIAFEDSRRNNDINVSFRRIPLASINPYYTTFAGYEVKSGSLSYDSRFVTQDGQLKGDNRFVINQMQLGNKIPDYQGKNIPLELIVALLEDENGVIDLNLKVEGNVDKPDFKVGDLIWDAVWTILGNIVSAPFKMIGRLIGIEGETGIYFEPGKSTLRPSESLKLENLVAGMQKRPKTKLQVNGVYDPEVDQLNLSTEKVDREVFKNAGFKLLDSEPLPQLPFEDERVQRALRRLYSGSFGSVPSNLNLKEGPSGVDGWKELHNQLVQKAKVSEEELTRLAQARALTIKQELVKINQEMNQRINIVDFKKETSAKDGVPVGIEIVSN